MTADELIALNEQIAGMARAGLPLDQGLATLARDMGRGRLRAVTNALASDLASGTPLPEAVERHRADLPPYYANLIMAGVRTGRLPEVLATLTAYARSVATTRTIVVESLLYPIVVLLLATGLLGVLLFFVLPQFKQIFDDFQMRLPALTEVVLVVGAHPLPVLAVPIALVVLVLLVRMMLGMTPRGRQMWARLIYSIPVIGTLIRSARLAAFAELLSVLVDYEMPLPEAFRMAGEASSDPLMAGRAWMIYTRLSQGVPLSMALRGLGLLPEWVAWMAGAGEQRGGLAQSLRQIAAVYRRQVDSRSALLRSVLPAFMIVLTAGVLVGVFAISVMLPMVRLLEGLAK
jgi:type II secretory pathway component PulF